MSFSRLPAVGAGGTVSILNLSSMSFSKTIFTAELKRLE